MAIGWVIELLLKPCFSSIQVYSVIEEVHDVMFSGKKPRRHSDFNVRGEADRELDRSKRDRIACMVSNILFYGFPIVLILHGENIPFL